MRFASLYESVYGEHRRWPYVKRLPAAPLRLDHATPGRYTPFHITHRRRGDRTMDIVEQSRPSDQQLRQAKMLIGGEWVDAASGATLTVENPGRRSPVATIPRGAAEDVNRAATAAHKAFPDWSKVPP